MTTTIVTYAAVPTVVDSGTFIGASVLGLVPALLALVVVLILWWRGRDEMFDDVTPGLVPTDGASAGRHRIRGGEWKGTVAPAFAPPRAMAPGVAGTVVDGIAHAHDVSAVIVDLAVRGHFRIVEVAHPEPRDSKPRDWDLVRATEPTPDVPSTFESALLTSLFAGGDTVRLSTLKGSFGMTMREAQIGLYREVVDRGWYRRHPRARNARARFWGLLVLVPLTLMALVLVVTGIVGHHDWSLAPLFVGAVLALVILMRWGGARTPRTALGTAARIEALGFREYLATAEADQLKFEELRTIVAQYLPWAIAFGLTGHWATLFAALAKDGDWRDFLPVDLGWYSGPDGWSIGDALSDVGSLGDLGDLGSLGDIDLGDIGFDLGGVGDAGNLDLADGLGNFTDATDSLFDIDGLSGCADGCDLPGCDF